MNIATPIPPFVTTEQASAFQARATLLASEGRMSELAIESTSVALKITSSIATESYFARRTEQMQDATATAAQSNFDATSTAGALTHTQAALHAVETATQSSIQYESTTTSIAIGVMQASATAQIERIMEQRESERQTMIFRTWAGRISLVILFIGGLLIVGQSINWILLRVFGIHRLANRPVVITPDGHGGFNIFDISRSFQPGASVHKNGQLITGGGAQDPQLQNQVSARAQAAELLLAANSGQNSQSQRRSMLRHAFQVGAPQQKTESQPSEDIDANIIVIPPDDPRIQPILDEVEPKLLNGGVSE